MHNTPSNYSISTENRKLSSNPEILPLTTSKRWLALAMIALISLLTEPIAAGSTYRVGAGCTYTSIQDAIDAIPVLGTGEIRVRSGTYTENLIISRKNVQLIGGHSNCVSTTPTGTSSINGSEGTSPVIAFFVNSGAADLSVSLTLERLVLLNGTGNILAKGGGLSVFTSSDRFAQVSLINSVVRQNQTSFFGGGIALEGSGSLTLLENSQIHDNTVTGKNPDGGGLYCAGDYTILAFGGSIFGNTAGQSIVNNARGGGIFLDDCDLTWYAQTAITTSDDASLRSNIVYGNGGGLYARGGAQVDLRGSSFSFSGPASVRPLRIHDNRAERVTVQGITRGGSGGGVFANGAGTEVTVDRAWTYNNEAGAAGGGFVVEFGAVLEVLRSSQICHTPRNCSRVFDNYGRIAGGAVDSFDAEVIIRRTIVARNDSEFGDITTRGSIDGFGSVIRILDSLIYGDVGPGHAVSAWDSTLFIVRSTIADTRPSRAVLGFNGDSSLTLTDSIVHETGAIDIVNVDGGTLTATNSCVMWHDDALASFGSNSNTVVADPRFIDRANDSYYLRPDSPAINYCGFEPAPPAVDLDWNPRGICHSVPVPVCPVDQIYDLGAYELPLIIFQDRFEL